jgi:hypothetical protein
MDISQIARLHIIDLCFCTDIAFSSKTSAGRLSVLNRVRREYPRWDESLKLDQSHTIPLANRDTDTRSTFHIREVF